MALLDSVPSGGPAGLEMHLLDDSSSFPGSPPAAAVETQPRWLRPDQSPRRRRWRRIAAAWLTACLRIRIRPRPSWRRLLCVALAAYALACFARGMPLLASPLPDYTGPHRVGAVDLEIPLQTPRHISDAVLRRTGEPAFEQRTTLLTLYYPTAAQPTAETKPRHPWLARPIGLTAEGYAKFAHVDNFVTRPILTFALWAIAGSIDIPAHVDAPLLGAAAAADDDDDDNSHGHGSARFPVMVFSHGDASSRTGYTNFVGELASRGYVVATVEHRDGSCPGTLVKIKGQSDRPIAHFAERDLLSEPPMDAPTWKREQLAFRDAEISDAIAILRAINDGQGGRLSALNARSEGSSLHTWAGRLDLGSLVIGGHSFGATAALQALKSAPPSAAATPAVGGIVLDPGKSSGPLNPDVSVPILVVHSHSWSQQHSLFYGRPHFDAVRDLVRAVLQRTARRASWFLTSLGTSHPSVSDAPLIEPLLLSCTTGASLNTKQALQEYVRVSVDFWEFLRRNREARGVLAEAATHEEYGKWVSKEREDEFPKDTAKLWEIHLSPASEM